MSFLPDQEDVDAAVARGDVGYLLEAYNMACEERTAHMRHEAELARRNSNAQRALKGEDYDTLKELRQIVQDAGFGWESFQDIFRQLIAERSMASTCQEVDDG